MAAQKKIRTSQFALYLKCERPNASYTGDTFKTSYLLLNRSWKRIEKQSSFEIKYSAETSEDKWIDEATTNTSVDGYKLTIDGELVAHTGDPIFSYLEQIRRKLSTGLEAESAVCIVNKYSTHLSSGYVTCTCDIFPCTIQINSISGEGAGNVSISYSLNLRDKPLGATIKFASDGSVYEITEGTTYYSAGESGTELIDDSGSNIATAYFTCDGERTEFEFEDKPETLISVKANNSELTSDDYSYNAETGIMTISPALENGVHIEVQYNMPTDTEGEITEGGVSDSDITGE